MLNQIEVFFMKNFKILLVLAAAVAILSSCNKEYAEPTIAWTPDALSHYVDIADATTLNVDLAITFTAEAGITEIVIWKHIYEGEDITSVTMVSPTGYDGLTSFEYNFVTTNTATDFVGVDQIVYEFVVTDASETPQTKAKEYQIYQTLADTYTVTFNVIDEADAAITDAIVTFNGTTNAAGVYTFAEVEAGTYTYTVAKDGYADVTVADFAVVDADVTVDVTLVEELPTAWTGPLALALETTESWASYNGDVVGIYQSDLIGFAFTNTTASTVTVTSTANCEGWVLVDDMTALTTEGALESAYAAGTALTTYDLPYDQHKAFEARYFVAKIGANYVLVEYLAGHRDTTTGNIVVFQYKD